MSRPVRVLITKIGLDGHDRGSKIVAAFLRDAGMEVIYTGPWQKNETVLKIALEEDVDLIGISTLANDYVLIPALMDTLQAADCGDIPVVVGGIVPAEEEEKLLAVGVSQVFHPGATREEIVSSVSALAVNSRQNRECLS